MKTARQVIFLLLILFLFLTFGLFAFADNYIELSIGSSGNEVYDLQNRLTALGYNTNGIDGWYGDGTKNAVKAFQSRNGMPVTGIATTKVQQLLFSNEAKGPFIPNLDIVSVSYNGRSASIYLKNNTSKTVDSLVLYIFTYDKSGNLYAADTSVERARMPGYYEVSVSPITSGNTGYANVNINSYAINNNVNTISIAIKAYHTADGNDYEYSENQLLLKGSDGSIILPTGESEPDKMSDVQMRKASQVLFGYNFCPITSDIAPLYRLGATGDWINTVTGNSTADKAGLKVNDVLMAFDNEPVGNAHAAERAKLRMLDGEKVTVHYLRANKEYTTVIALDMDSITSKESSTDSKPLTDQLKELADLYQAGLLTEEQYETAKEKLLG